MKHYFSPFASFRSGASNNTLEIYAPFDGVIYRVTDEGHDSGFVNKQVWIQSSISPDTFAILFHVNLLDIFPQYWNDFPAEHWPYHGEDDPNYDRLTVSSGEMIGYADLRGTISDIAILKKVGVKEYHYLSYFDEAVMTERVFETYREYDLANRDDVIICSETLTHCRLIAGAVRETTTGLFLQLLAMFRDCPSGFFIRSLDRLGTVFDMCPHYSVKRKKSSSIPQVLVAFGMLAATDIAEGL